MTGTLNVAHRAEQRREQHATIAQALDELAAIRAHSTATAEQLATLTNNGVIETGTVQLDTAGVIERRFHVPFAAVAVLNPGASTLTVHAGPRGIGAPSAGAGVFIVPAGCFAVVNVAAPAVTFYGAAGELVSYSVFVRPQPPAAGQLGGGLYGTYQTPGDTAVKVNSAGQLVVAGGNGDNLDGVAAGGSGMLRSTAETYAYNGGSWDRLRTAAGAASSGVSYALAVATGSNPLISLNGAAATGAGALLDNLLGRDTHAVSVYGVTATSWSITLEGTIDGNSWFPLGTIDNTNTSGGYLAVSGKPVRKLRANLTQVTGGSVSAAILSTS